MATLTITAKDGTGSFSAYVAKPEEQATAAILVIQEIFGVNGDMRAKCDAFAAQGYIAICPDLFWRQEPGVDITDKTKAEWDKALALLGGLDIDKAIEDLTATMDVMRAMHDCNGKIGCVGYCIGGKLAYLMAARTDINLSVSYYGVGLQDLLGEAKNIKRPLILHIAELDKFSNPQARDQVVAAFANDPNVTAIVYPGVDHAFARLNGEHYDASAAAAANTRTDAFFAEHLKG